METNNLTKGSIVSFNVSKELIFVKALGSGGTGDTNLFFDETTSSYFAIKKYVPKGSNDTDDNFKRFIEEIKILYRIVHPNVVRIFNYYLYPLNSTGYIQMEYIEGRTLDQFSKTEKFGWNEIFIQTIDAFAYLEKINILHRDIRPANFMVTDDNVLKVIDFGFGKEVDANRGKQNSVVLNWSASEEPEELVLEGEYNFKTEIYYLGHMFKKLINQDDSFSYTTILAKMCEIKTLSRYQSFNDILNDISSSLFNEIKFSANDKKTYKDFADYLMEAISVFRSYPSYENDSKVILERLGNVIKMNALEDTIKGVSNIIKCFLNKNDKFRYYPSTKISTLVIQDFYKLLIKSDLQKKKLIISNIQNRLDTVEVKISDDDDLPF